MDCSWCPHTVREWGHASTDTDPPCSLKAEPCTQLSELSCGVAVHHGQLLSGVGWKAEMRLSSRAGYQAYRKYKCSQDPLMTLAHIWRV